MVYKWKSISGIKADPQKAALQFEELEKTVGLTAQNLLDANRDPDAILHNEFEWDDTVAAEQYRVHQAGQIIRMLCVETESNPDVSSSTPIRAYFQTSENKSYEHISVILKNESKYQEMLSRAYSELKTFQRKYEKLSELKPIFDAIDSWVDRIE